MELKIDNMTCGGCVSSVRRILAKQLELEETAVDVQLATGRATIPPTDPERLEVALQKLARAGFPASAA